MVDASGQIISKSRYLPFGELLWEDGSSPTDYTYTGQRSLSDIGLMDYNARFYDPMLGRFTSPDSIVPDAGSVIGYNRYAYVYNNPIVFTDPSGHKIALDDFNDGMTVRYVSTKDYFVIVDGGPTLANFTEKGFANYMNTGDDYFLNNCVPDGADSFSYGAAMESAAEGIGKDAGIENRKAIAAIAIILSSINGAFAASPNYVDTEFNIMRRSENLSDQQLNGDLVNGGIETIENDLTVNESESGTDTKINTGTSKAPWSSQPNSIWERYNSDGTIRNRAFYDENGRQFSRQDYDHRHYDKVTEQYYQPHEHNFSYNEAGYPNGETVGPVPSGY